MVVRAGDYLWPHAPHHSICNEGIRNVNGFTCTFRIRRHPSVYRLWTTPASSNRMEDKIDPRVIFEFVADMVGNVRNAVSVFLK